MSSHTVKRGECVLAIASHYGLPWEEVWNYAGNKPLRELRKSPNILREGDTVEIPPIPTKTVSLATGVVHKIVITVAKATVRLRLHTARGEPRTGLPFMATVDGSSVAEGESNSDGVCEALVATNVETVHFVVQGRWGEERFDVEVGYLDPLDEDAGVQNRLDNLGYQTTDGDAWDDDSTEALKRFQSRNDLDVTGEVDDATRQALEKANGC